MKLGWKSIEKMTIEDMNQEKRVVVSLMILFLVTLAMGTFADAQQSVWWMVCYVLFVSCILRYSIIAVAIGLKKEIQELKDKIEKLG